MGRCRDPFQSIFPDIPRQISSTPSTPFNHPFLRPLQRPLQKSSVFSQVMEIAREISHSAIGISTYTWLEARSLEPPSKTLAKILCFFHKLQGDCKGNIPFCDMNQYTWLEGIQSTMRNQYSVYRATGYMQNPYQSHMFLHGRTGHH